jgi:DNA-binding response OmpR family regulator
MKNLLVVDDDRSVCSSLQKLLQAEGFEVFAAWDGAEAIRLFRTHDIDLVVLDINLGTDNGWDVFQAMVEMKPSVPTVVITAEWGQRDRAVAAGAEVLIEKPIDVPSFLRVIDGLLADNAEHKLRRICNSERYCHYMAKDYATFLKLLEERHSAPLNLPIGLRTAPPESESEDTLGAPAKRFTVIGDPTASMP